MAVPLPAIPTRAHKNGGSRLLKVPATCLFGLNIPSRYFAVEPVYARFETIGRHSHAAAVFNGIPGKSALLSTHQASKYVVAGSIFIKGLRPINCGRNPERLDPVESCGITHPLPLAQSVGMSCRLELSRIRADSQARPALPF